MRIHHPRAGSSRAWTGNYVLNSDVLDVDVPGGATIWLRQGLAGPYEIEFTAVPISAGGPNDLVTDLNTFWNARDARSPNDIFATSRGGAFAEYDHLRTYYAGQGANLNTTTRFRRYVGEPGNRPLVFDYTDPAPYDSGWFAFRTVAGHFTFADFTVWRPPSR
ncbi:hypothetical protein J2S43_007549 [Catenuloplanes nepalensis]|uniref:DUF6250 domain-containing protein n=1 Tax=Catenuloplanes nepalensis TaxID=587533 RepID=A0ABT9N5Q3_9ACTN|nr:DUF6250 domain-containing protein [Catenuloplanes nepalensis]MDP9799037.1 hypothetical protein [Catenuloplanes nepalensis]